MAFPFYIARRYLFSRKSHHAINVISGISVCGVAFATAALVCILSVFNGFQDMIASWYTAFDPQLKITPAEGKYMVADDDRLTSVHSLPIIDEYMETIEDNALLVVGNCQAMVTIKGVEDNFQQLTDIDDLLIATEGGRYRLRADVLDFGVMGTGVFTRLGIPADLDFPIEVFAPKQGERVDLTDPRESLTQEELFLPGVMFQVKQSQYDNNYVITHISFARRLFERQGYCTGVELRLKPGTDMAEAKSMVAEALGADYVVKNRYEQQEETFRIMKIEKLISYVFLTFILLIACFNIVGSLSMLMIDKKDDVVTLRNLGASERQIRSIFMLEGRMISLAGAIAGIGIGLLLCWLQDRYGLITFGADNQDSFLLSAYPVSVHFWDIALIFATVVVVGFIAVWYPVHHISRKLTARANANNP